MSETSIILEIPIEVLHIIFRVEKDDPLKPLMDGMKSIKKIESNSQSVHRLDALTRSSSSNSKMSEYSTPVMRDLWKGKYWTMGQKSLSLDDDITGSIHQLEPIQKLDVNKSEGEVKDLAKPFLGWLASESKIDRKKILGHVRLESLKSSSEVLFLRTRISQKEDRTGRNFWVYEEGPFKQLIGDYIDKEPGFEMDELEVTKAEHEWPYSPEIKALHEFKKAASKFSDKPEVVQEKTLDILDTILDQIKQDERPRLDWVKQVVGFRQDMWDAAQEVIRSAKKQVFIVTSFSNPRFSDDVAKLLAEASKDRKPDILLSFGEPDRGRSPEDIQNTEQYIATLAKDKRFKLKGGVSSKSSHTKLVISDTGNAFISSCNLFSGSLESGVLESGLLIKDIRCAKSMLEVSNEEEWIPTQLVTDTDKMYSDLGKIKRPKFSLMNVVEKQIAEIKNDIKSGEDWYAYTKLERMLRDIAERPTWSLIRTLEHRPFMADCIERFDKRIVMASDGLRSNGLDKATIRRIGQRASKSEASVHIWWGRHAPNSKPFDEVDKRGRQEAKKQLQQLQSLEKPEKIPRLDKNGKFLTGKYGEKLYKVKRDKKTKKMIMKNGKPDYLLSSAWKLLPRSSFEPMETHAKMFIVDDTRLMITSDNTLSFGDTEYERGDAGELGLMIDHPRLALQTRGSMELWLPDDVKIPGDLARWWSLLGEEVSLHTSKPSEQMSLIGALDSMVERIESNEFLRVAWEQEVEEISNRDELTIVNKLGLGVRFGIYCIAKNRGVSGIKSKLKPEQVEKSVISLSRNNMWEDSK
jgi:phosphatidylserine/phosphatidylglycerophosphate/cardiolipin synthase-like enzyme